MPDAACAAPRQRARAGLSAPSPSARTLRADSEARVYASPGGIYYACTYRNRRRVIVGSANIPWERSSGGGGTLRVILTGHFVAAVNWGGGNDSGITAYLSVFRLSDGKRILSHAVSPGGSAHLHDVVLTKTGAAAWIQSARSQPNPVPAPTTTYRPIYEVWSSTSTGVAAELEEAPDVELGSLAAARARVYWTRAGQTNTAVLR